MAKASKDTLQVVVARMNLCSAKPTEDAKGKVFIFQGDEVIVDGALELRISADDYLSKLDDEQLSEHGGSVKFTIPNQQLTSKKCDELRKLKPRDRAIIEYGVSPQSSVIEKNQITYAKTKFLSVQKPADNRTSTTTRTPANAAASS